MNVLGTDVRKGYILLCSKEIALQTIMATIKIENDRMYLACVVI